MPHPLRRGCRRVHESCIKWRGTGGHTPIGKRNRTRRVRTARPTQFSTPWLPSCPEARASLKSPLHRKHLHRLRECRRSICMPI